MGPLSMFQHLVHVWGKDRIKQSDDQNPCLEPAEIAKKVKFFFHHSELEQAERLAGHIPDFDHYMEIRLGTTASRIFSCLLE